MNNYYNETNMKYNEVEAGMTPAMDTNMEMPTEEGCCMPQSPCEPIYECPQERVCHKYINYEVPHIMPCHTRIVKHHVYRHTYRPCYTCCEENVVCNIHDRKCC